MYMKSQITCKKTKLQYVYKISWIFVENSRVTKRFPKKEQRRLFIKYLNNWSFQFRKDFLYTILTRNMFHIKYRKVSTSDTLKNVLNAILCMYYVCILNVLFLFYSYSHRLVFKRCLKPYLSWQYFFSAWIDEYVMDVWKRDKRN